MTSRICKFCAQIVKCSRQKNLLLMLLLCTNQLQFKPNTTDTLCLYFLPPRPLARPNPPNIDNKTSTFIRTKQSKTPILLQLLLAFHPESESSDNGNGLEYKITALQKKDYRAGDCTACFQSENYRTGDCPACFQSKNYWVGDSIKELPG